MTRLAVACVVACVPFVSARADDPKPDVVKLKDKVELLEAKLAVWKAKVAGAERALPITKEFMENVRQAERVGAVAQSDLARYRLTESQQVTDLETYKAELKVAEVKLAQAKRRLTAAEKVGVAPPKPEKTYSVRFENAKWADVVNWIQKETGLIYAGREMPKGGITIKPAGNKQFTLAEVVDLLNEALETEHFQLIRRQQTFTLWPADEKIESQDVARVSRAELARRGKTEYVQILVEFDSRFEETLLPFVKKLFRPDGRVTAVGDDRARKAGTSAVVLQERAENLRKVLTVFDLVPAPAKAVNSAVPIPEAK